MTHHLKKELGSGRTLVGTIVSLPSPQVVEILSHIGFDWLFIDAEHAPLGMGEIQGMLQASGDRCPCVVRIPVNEEVFIKQSLDIGAAGIIAPLVNTPASAARVVSLAKYPPVGTRSVGIGRAHGYGRHFQDYLDHANDEIAVIVQIEHVEGAKNIDAILDVAGIDAVFIGPYDLSGSLGKPGKVSDPDVRGTVDRIREVCLKRGMPLGVFSIDTETARSYVAQGYSLVAVGTDTMLLGNAAAELLVNIKAPAHGHRSSSRPNAA